MKFKLSHGSLLLSKQTVILYFELATILPPLSWANHHACARVPTCEYICFVNRAREGIKNTPYTFLSFTQLHLVLQRLIISRGANPRTIALQLERALHGIYQPCRNFSTRNLEIAFLVKAIGGPGCYMRYKKLWPSIYVNTPW